MTKCRPSHTRDSKLPPTKMSPSLPRAAVWMLMAVDESPPRGHSPSPTLSNVVPSHAPTEQNWICDVSDTVSKAPTTKSLVNGLLPVWFAATSQMIPLDSPYRYSSASYLVDHSFFAMSYCAMLTSWPSIVKFPAATSTLRTLVPPPDTAGG